jgi:proteasome lid subunit RPN8/RPN11
LDSVFEKHLNAVETSWFMPKFTALVIPREILQTIFEAAKHVYPRETILLLRGKKRGEKIFVTELLVPPLASYGKGFAHIPIHMLPIDLSIVGTAHSHPSGNLTPSPTDMNHFFGIVLLIAGPPFRDKQNVAAYNRGSEKLTVEVNGNPI